MFTIIWRTSPLIRFAICAITIWTLSRFGLGLFFAERIGDSATFAQILFNGLRVDIASLSQWLLVALLFALPASFTAGRLNRFLQHALGLWLILGLVAILLLEVATPTFISQFDVRPNRLFIEYLNSPKEVGGMLLKGFGFEVFGGMLLTALGGWICWRLLDGHTPIAASTSIKSRAVMGLVYLALVPVLIIGARSGLQHRPINPAMVAVSNDRLLNSLALNSIYSVGYAAYASRHDKGSRVKYGEMTITEAIEALDQEIAPSAHLFEPATVHRDSASGSALGKDLLIVVLESHGAHFVESLGGHPASPNIDRWRNKSWFFDNLYATGIRSARGLEAIVTGLPPTPAKSVLKRTKSQSNFFTLAAELKLQGYTSQFIYGGESHFDNMKGFFLNNGFDQVIDQYDYQSPAFMGSWGVSDEDLFDELYRRLTLPSDQKQFFLAFTSSNHPPFEYPEGRIEQIGDDAATALNSAKYADYALGKFLDRLEQENRLEHLLVLVIADHEDKVFGSEPVPFSKFHIPGFILLPGSEPRLDKRIASQIDMAPTLLSLLGVTHDTPLLGHDLTSATYPGGHAIMQFGDNVAYMTEDGICYLQPGAEPILDTHDRADRTNTELCDIALAYETWTESVYALEQYSLVK